MSTLQEYKCPCCDGAIAFDPNSQKMECPYCGSEFEMETLVSYDKELQNDSESNMKWETNAGVDWREGETEGLRVYHCNSCGGEIVGDDTLAASKCPYCGNPVVMMGQLSGGLKPDIIVPFKIDKKAAKKALVNHYTGKKFLPKVFKNENHLEEIKGVYVPFWLFDADARANIRYKATRTRTWSDSRYDYTETSFYNVTRQGKLGFSALPVDGSTKMADDLMESIEPFDIAEGVPFQTAYLAGFVADKYDVDSKESIERANERIKKSTEEAFENTVDGYTTVVPASSSISLANSSAKYALLPVWILNTDWKGQKYTFAMNGQTGKFVGDLPLDKGAYKRSLWGLAALLSAACLAVSYLIWLF
ncbi:MAG: hypothetical protein E7656_09585 [Ruminococcaceae bacterium]|nr:hypothetical protein [Oscillospiraceae bacterium]